MAVTPNTNIRLLKTPFEIDNKNQLTFSNVNAQRNYFLSLPYIEEDNCSYQRKDNIIRFPAHIDNILNYNYVMYKNEAYSNKWFYAYITEMKYLNNSTTEISIETDVFQTWQFDIIYKKMFVEREHVSNDTIGMHTIPENLDIGGVIEELVTEDAVYGNSFGYFIAVASNWEINDNSTGNEVLESSKGTQNAGISVYDNTIFGTELFLFNITGISSFTDLVLFLLRTNYDGHIGDVQNMFILPNLAINPSKLIQHSATCAGNTFNWYTLSYDMTPETFNTSINKRQSFSDYTPKNNKCFVYPYNYLFVSNNQGNHNIYKYEDFNSNNCVFENQFSIAVGGSGRLVPKNYKGMPTNDDESLALGKYPTCAWSSDAFTNWLTQNSVNMVANLALTAGGIATSIATGGATMPIVAGAISSASGSIANVIGSFHEALLAPNISGGQATGDIIWSANRNLFSFREMRIKTEYLKIIDEFFSAYGYKVNSVKLPNITGRQNWNYVKTIEANILGDIPQEDLQTLKNMLNNGVTFWHNANTFLDYSQSNNII